MAWPRCFWRFGFDPRLCKNYLPRKPNIAGAESKAHFALKRQIAAVVLKLGWRVGFEIEAPVGVPDVVCIHEDRLAGFEVALKPDYQTVVAKANEARRCGFSLFWCIPARRLLTLAVPRFSPDDITEAVIASLLASAQPYECAIDAVPHWVLNARHADALRRITRRAPLELRERVQRAYQGFLNNPVCANDVHAFLTRWLEPVALKRLGLNIDA